MFDLFPNLPYFSFPTHLDFQMLCFVCTIARYYTIHVFAETKLHKGLSMLLDVSGVILGGTSLQHSPR